MDLKLANDVVYAILGTVGFIFLIVYTTRIIRIRSSFRYDQKLIEDEQRFDHANYASNQPQNTAPWPAVTQETQK